MAVYPPRGSTPWDLTLKSYIDEANQTFVDDLAAHEADTANPHAVTAAQVGAIALPAAPVAGDLLRFDGAAWAKSATRFFEGTGNPNGVVTAPVGSTFVNTEAGGWNGARRWTKTGAGSTGWVVVDGDTGPRDITALLANGWAAPGSASLNVRIWRTTDTTTLGGQVDKTAATSPIVLTLPADWRPTVYAFGSAASTGANASRVQVQTGGVVAINDYAAVSGGTVAFGVTWPMRGWPSTLIGLPG